MKLKDSCGQKFNFCWNCFIIEKCRTVLEVYKCVLYDAVDVLASENEVLPHMKYLQCELSKLATTLRAFP